jgi:hypothetical protein
LGTPDIGLAAPDPTFNASDLERPLTLTQALVGCFGILSAACHPERGEGYLAEFTLSAKSFASLRMTGAKASG